jgi:protein TonB
MNTTWSPSADGMSIISRLQLRRLGPMTLIVLLHLGFFYMLQSGLLRQAVQALPNEVFATLIAVDTPPPEEPKPQPQPAPPKTVPLVKKAPTRPPVIATPTPAPAPEAITAPPEPPAPLEPPAPAAAPAVPVAAAPTPAPPRTISSGVEYLQPPRLEYPSISKRRGEEGKVLLRVLVNEKGRAERVEVQQSSNSMHLDEAARQAVLRALFKPYMEDGKAVAVYAIVPIRFQLN